MHKKRFTLQLVGYAAVSAVGLGVDFSLVILSKELLQVHYLVATTIGFIGGLIVTFLLSNRFIFTGPKSSRRKLFVLFGGIGVVGLLILSGLMWLLTGRFGIDYRIAKILATGIVFLWNFLARRKLYKNDSASQLPYEL